MRTYNIIPQESNSRYAIILARTRLRVESEFIQGGSSTGSYVPVQHQYELADCSNTVPYCTVLVLLQYEVPYLYRTVLYILVMYGRVE